MRIIREYELRVSRDSFYRNQNLFKINKFIESGGIVYGLDCCDTRLSTYGLSEPCMPVSLGTVMTTDKQVFCFDKAKNGLRKTKIIFEDGQ